MDARFLTVFLAVSFASFLQGTPFAAIFGVKVGFVLAAVFFAAFFVPSFSWYCAVAVLSVALIVIPSGSFSVAVPLLIVFLAGYLVRRAASWQPWLSYPALLFAATFLLYGLIDVHFLVAHPEIILREGAYTAIFGVVLYLFIAIPHDVSRRHTF